MGHLREEPKEPSETSSKLNMLAKPHRTAGTLAFWGLQSKTQNGNVVVILPAYYLIIDWKIRQIEFCQIWHFTW